MQTVTTSIFNSFPQGLIVQNQHTPLTLSTHIHNVAYTIIIVGYFRGVYILQISKLLQFVELIFAKIMETTPVYLGSDFTGAIFAEIFISRNSQNTFRRYTPRK